MTNFRGKTTLITGAASGIGRATALAFANSGAKVVVSDIDEGGAEATVGLIKEMGGEAVFIRADVSNKTDVERLIEETLAAYKTLAGGYLQPSFLESGWEGIWTPVAMPRLGYCEYNCNLCGQVCPTGAIQNLEMEKKQKLKMGIAYFDKSRCIPWYSQQDCLVCQEHCPTPDKAIKFDIREARTPDGGTRTVKFPYVDEELCIGCGICVTKCPVVGKAGIFVTNASAERIEV